jgi:membrane protease YdiL (CAAX protease family)
MRILEFLNDLFNPKKYKPAKRTVWRSFEILLKLFAVDVSFFIVYVIITALLIKYHAIELPRFKPEGFDTGRGWDTIFRIVLIAPLFEESLFRLNLKSNSLKLSIGTSVLFHEVLLILFNRKVSDNYLLSLGSLILIFLAFYFFLRKHNSAIENAVKRNIPWIFYTSAILFGLIHLDNYDLTNVNPLVALFYILPHTVAGFLFGYARMRLGFWYGYAFHGLSNAITFLPGLLS